MTWQRASERRSRRSWPRVSWGSLSTWSSRVPRRYGGSPTFTASANYGGSPGLPAGVTLNTSGFSCTTVGTSTTIGPTLAPGNYTLLPTSCSGATLGGANSAYYSIVYTSAANDFSVTLAPVNVAVAGSQTYGGTPSFSAVPAHPRASRSTRRA